MEVEITTSTGTTTEKLQISQREETFSIKIDGEPTSVIFDKDLKIPLKLIKIQSAATAKKSSS